MRGIHRQSLVNSPHKGPVTRKMFSFHDAIMPLPLCVLSYNIAVRNYMAAVVPRSLRPSDRHRLDIASKRMFFEEGDEKLSHATYACLEKLGWVQVTDTARCLCKLPAVVTGTMPLSRDNMDNVFPNTHRQVNYVGHNWLRRNQTHLYIWPFILVLFSPLCVRVMLQIDSVYNTK